MLNSRIIHLIFILFITISFKLDALDDFLAPWSTFARSREAGELMQWIGDEAYRILGMQRNRKVPFIAVPPVYGSLGLFITLVKDGSVRGCFGSFQHSESDMETLIRYYLKGALRQDPRSEPLGLDELDETEIILTVTSQPWPVSRMEEVDISDYGLVLILADGTERAYVPAEIRTHDYLRRITGSEKVQALKAFKAVTIRNGVSD